ncbi:MAG: DUF4422 domain-containing protein [Kiritimatiellae bacterium]|nr:DUF4422 domain-containing protein [Kiritimatiellia bacterium]
MGFLKDRIYWILRDWRNHSFDWSHRLCAGKNIRIFILRHKDQALSNLFSDRTLFFPVNCGNSDFSQTELDAFSDKKGTSISEYNPFLNEMTGIWWIGHHLKEVGNPDYIGIGQYRRLLEWDARLLSEGVVFANSGIFRRSIYKWFVLEGHPDISALFISEFKYRFRSSEYRDFDTYLIGHEMFVANLMVTDKKTFLRYVDFIDKVIVTIVQMIKTNAINLQVLEPINRRVYGFFLEQMTSYWIYHEERQRRIRVIRSRAQTIS